MQCELIGTRVHTLHRKAHDKTKAEQEELAKKLENMQMSDSDESDDESYTQPSTSESEDSGRNMKFQITMKRI